MKALRNFRGHHVDLQKRFDARPSIRTTFGQQRQVLNYADLLAWEVEKPDEIQHTDGTFAFLPGYDSP